MSEHLAFNTAVSFVTNTNWQSYGGETTLSYFSQMVGLDRAEFRLGGDRHGHRRAAGARLRPRQGDDRRQLLGRSHAHDALRAAAAVDRRGVRAIALGVPQNLSHYVDATTLEGAKQTIAQGPVASQIAIKQLGTNGGGFFNVNSAHPYENPNIWTEHHRARGRSSRSRWA